MPLRLNAGIDWTARAHETRQMAEQEPDPVTKAWLNGLVKEYERLAARTPEGSKADN